MREFKTVQSTAYLIRHALSTLISVSPSSLGVIFFEGVLKLRIRLPGCRVDIKEITARWQELSFNQHSPFVLLIYLDLKQNSPWCKTKVREFTTDQRTVRVIRAYSLIFPAPSVRSRSFSLKGVVTLRTRPPGCRIDIKENAACWQELSFNQHSLCFAYLPWFKTKLTLINSRWGS